MTTIDLGLFIVTLNTVIYILGLADFCLGGCINSVKRCKGQFIFPHGLATCSFGGLTRDVILTPFFTGAFVIPGLSNSVETWVIAAIVVAVFGIIYKGGRFEIFEYESFDLPFAVLDALALGNFTVIGVLAAAKLGYTSEAVQILYGLVTATGGGVFSILMWAHNKRKLLQDNLWYYITAVISSSIASIGISRGFNHEAVYLACSALCAAVYVVRKAVAEGIRNTYFRSNYCRIYAGFNCYMGRIRSGEYYSFIKSIPHERMKLYCFLINKHQVLTGTHGLYCSC